MREVCSRADRPLVLAWLAMTVATLVACTSSDEDPEDFCGDGTRVVDRRCVSILTCGPNTNTINDQCVPAGGSTEINCGTGTVLSDGLCIVDATACLPGTILEEGGCAPEATTACGVGTALGETGCEVAESACGAGTALGEAGCELAATACGTDTTLSEGACVSAVSCGEGTALEEGACVAQLYCDAAQGAVEIEDGSGAPVCVSEVFGEVTAETFSSRFAENYCGGRDRCGCEEPGYEIMDDGGGDFGPISPFVERESCIKFMTWYWDIITGLPEARLLMREDPPRATFDIELANIILDVFGANDECQLDPDPEDIERLIASGNLFGNLFQGDLDEGETCASTQACGAGLVCRDPDPLNDGDVRQCMVLAEEGELCEETDNCPAGFYCDWNSGSTCQAVLGVGDGCSNDTDCEAGLSCWQNTDTGSACQPLSEGAEGYTCDNSDDCGDAEYCDYEAATPSCLPQVAMGEECPVSGACGDNGLCDLPEEGEPGTCVSAIDFCQFEFFDR